MRTSGRWSPWLIVLAVLSRLHVTINAAAPATRPHSRPMLVQGGDDDEQQIERMYEMLDSYHQDKRSAAAAAAARHRDARTGTGATPPDGAAGTGHSADSVPKFHYEVHHVTHQLGHRTPADVKLRQVARHAASASDDDDQQQQQDRSSLPAAAAAAAPPHRALDNDDRALQQTDDDDDEYWYYYNEEDGSKRASAGVAGMQQPLQSDSHSPSSIANVYFVAVVVGCSVAGLAGLMVAAVCWYRLHKKMKATSEVSYPAYGVTGPVGSPPNSKDQSPGDRKLAQTAQMYHYQHQKQQMIASERLSQEQASGGRVDARSDVEDEESDNDDNDDDVADYTVFECRGLGATNGEMEVRNPLFSDQQTAVTGSSAPATSATAPPSQANK